MGDRSLLNIASLSQISIKSIIIKLDDEIYGEDDEIHDHDIKAGDGDADEANVDGDLSQWTSQIVDFKIFHGGPFINQN